VELYRGMDSLVLRQVGRDYTSITNATSSCEPSFRRAQTDSTSAVATATQRRCNPAGDSIASHDDASSDGITHAAAHNQYSPWVSVPARD